MALENSDVQDALSLPDPYATNTMLNNARPHASHNALARRCTSFSHPYPSPVPTKDEQEKTDDLLSFCHPLNRTSDLYPHNASPKQYWYFLNEQRTLLFIFTRFAGKKEFSLEGLELQAKTFLSRWFDGSKTWAGYWLFARTVEESVYLGVAVGTRMRLWNCSRVIDAKNNVKMIPLWGGEKQGDWAEYLEMGDCVEGVRLRQEIENMFLEAGLVEESDSD